MRSELNYRTFEFAGVPMTGTIRRHPLDSRLVAVDVATSLVWPAEGRQYFFGYSMGVDSEEALFVACCEILERMLATRAFYTAEELRDGFLGSDLMSGATVKRATVNEVLIREEPGLDSVRLSASGLGLHSDYGRAVDHGLREILERHLLVDVWYGGRHIFPVKEPEIFPDGYVLNFYGVAPDVPFVLCVLQSQKEDVFFSGSAIGRGFDDALRKARKEALHQSCNHLCRDALPEFGNHRDSLERLRTLVGSGAREKHAHLRHRVRRRNWSPVSGEFKVGELARRVFGRDCEVIVYPLREWMQFKAVRVVVPSAHTKNSARAKFCGSGFDEDPFC